MLDNLRKWLGSFLSNCQGTDVVEINDTTATDLDYAIPEKWDTKIRLDAIKNAFWGKRFEGKQGSSSPIIINTDFTKGPGDKIHFQTMTRIKNAGVTGETTLTGSEVKLVLGQYDLEVDWLRNAVGFSKRGLKRANFDAVMVAGQELADWLARYVDDAMFEELVSSESPSTIYAGNKSSEAALDSGSVFNTNCLDRIKIALIRKGAIPLKVKVSGGVTLKYYGVVIDPLDGFNLRADDAWYSANKDANLRGLDNPIFSGALGIYNGIIVYEFGNIGGEMGTWLRPEAKLSIALGLATTTITCTIDSDTGIDALKYFPSSGTIRIDNEDMTYTSESGYYFTVSARGVNSTATTHAAGAIVSLRNITKQIGFGSEIAVRGWGLYPRATKEVQDYGFRNGVGIEAIFGQQAIKNKAGDIPNYVMMKSYAANPNSNI